MRMPDGDARADFLLESLGEYLLARLGAKRELKDLKEAFGASQGALRAKLEAEKAVFRAVQHAMAARDDADQTLDGKVRALFMTIQTPHKNRKTNPFHLKYFPDGLTAVTLAPLTDELIAVGKILDLLSSEGNDAVKGHEAAIREAAEGLKAAMAGYQGALNAADFASNATRAQALLWRDAYRKTYGELVARYPGDLAYAESFFKKAPKPKKGGGDEQGTAK